MVLTVKRAREAVKFDVTNRKHREDYNTFRETGSWKHSPYSFDLEFPYETIPHMCTSKLLEYYLSRDFKTADLIS
jgi:hypothetical protein